MDRVKENHGTWDTHNLVDFYAILMLANDLVDFYSSKFRVILMYMWLTRHIICLRKYLLP